MGILFLIKDLAPPSSFIYFIYFFHFIFLGFYISGKYIEKYSFLNQQEAKLFSLV